jgi:hypothetical protein
MDSNEEIRQAEDQKGMGTRKLTPAEIRAWLMNRASAKPKKKKAGIGPRPENTPPDIEVQRNDIPTPSQIPARS